MGSLEWTGRPAEVAFTLRWTFDRGELQEAVGAQGSFKRRLLRIRVLFLVTLVLAALSFALHPTVAGFEAMAGVLLAMLLIQALPWISVRQQWRANPRLQSEIEATVTNLGVRVRVPGSTTEHSWDAFQKVAETDRVFLLSFTPKAGSPFLALPKRALAGEAEVAALRDLLRRKIPTG
ncbi:MAG TPA: YcxB family protein [Actinomycetes bacterium]